MIQENQLNPKEISENPNEIDKNLNEENALNQNEKLKKAKGELIKIQMKAENEVIKSEKTKKQEDLGKFYYLHLAKINYFPTILHKIKW